MKNSHKFIWYNEKEYPLDILFDLKFSKIPYQSLFMRYKRKNKDMDIILNKPKQIRDMNPYLYKGKQYHLRELSNLKECKIKTSALWARLQKLSPEQALTISYEKHYIYFGKKYLYKDLIQLKEFNVTRDAFYKRIQHGWSVEKSVLVPMCSWSRVNQKLQYQIDILVILFYFLQKTSKN